MPEPTQIIFTFKEVVEALLKKQGIHEGIWGIYVKFAISAANVKVGLTPGSDQLLPTALVPVLELGIQKFESEGNLSVDASKVNPPSKSAVPSRRKK